MERQQAFTVLPPLSPRLPPPPPTPAPTRMAPRTVAHKDNSAFVILAEIGDSAPSGRASPFRGRGFREPSPPSSRIPILSGKSAPSSPVRNKLPPGGKSAPSSPKRVSTKPQPKKRNESPSKLPVSRKNSPLSTPIKEPPNRRLTAKPPIPKPNSPRRNNISNLNNINNGNTRAPQPARRSDLSKPLPAARTRLNNKPISTDIKIGINNKSDRPNLNVPTPATRKSNEKLNVPQTKSTSENTKTEKKEKKPKKEEKTETPTESVKPPDNEVTVITTNSESIHKLNIEITGPDDKNNAQISKQEVKNEAQKIEPTSIQVTVDQPLDVQSPGIVEKTVKEIEKSVETKDISKDIIEKTDAVEKVKEAGMADVSEKEVKTVVNVIEGVNLDKKVEMNGIIGNKDTKMELNKQIELAQPDVIPTDHPAVASTAHVGTAHVAETTVEGPPDVEVEAGNHTVTFRSPEIHPVSPRIPKKTSMVARIGDRMCSCCKKVKTKNNIIKVKGPVKAPVDKTDTEPKPSIFSRLCKWKRKPRPPPPKPKPKGPKRSLMSRMNCCKKTNKPIRLQAPSDGKSIWRKVFCLDKACCAKCKRNTNNDDGRKKDKSRSSSFVGLPKLEASLVEHTSVMKGAIPVLPICLAWFCLLLNIFLPGIGTIISGFLCMCFGKPRFSVNDSGVARLGSLCVNIIVGISQMFTILFCLVGWGWSIWWGVIMVRVSRKNRRIKLAEKASENAPAPIAVNQNHDVERGN